MGTTELRQSPGEPVVAGIGRRRLAMRRFSRKLRGAVVLAVLAPVLGGCSSDVGFSNISLAPKTDWLSFSGHKEEFTLRPPGPEDLVGPEGQCAGGAGEPAFDPAVGE